MSLFRRERLSLGLSADELVCLDAQGRAQCWPLPGDPTVPGVWADALSQALRAVGALERRAGRVQVVVANDLAQHWLCTPPGGTASLGELQAFASARRAQIHGDAPQDWRVTADWQVGGAFLCTAVPGVVVDALKSAFAKAGRLGIVTELAHAWAPRGPAWQGRPTGWLCLDSASGAALVSLAAGRPRALRTWRLPGQADKAARASMIAAEARREALRVGEAVPSQVRWLDLRHARPQASLIRAEGDANPTAALQGPATDGPLRSAAHWCAELARGAQAWSVS
ncbi:hypothetical protein EIP75_20915 [Aquabacterium soli]|uniref:Uncharacterized protein n=1 Tax=Aquabacterium soli TaxID=2493092 RepID=A0A3R8T2A0_9BURK|nr:hypothetical protein [Aquabacterium soli]RRS02411.1 hypothetical protein EIP75_20915 [Aquabacterium soli]